MVLLLVRLHIHGSVFLSLAPREVASAGIVNLLDDRQNQVKHVEDHVGCHEVQEEIGQIVTSLHVRDVVREQEHRPDADQHDQFVQNLHSVAPNVHHRLRYNEVNQEQGAEDVGKDHLQHEREPAEDDHSCE